jgi:hypothetical protein
MANPSFSSISTKQPGTTGAVTAIMPASWNAGDLLLLVVESSPASGQTAVAASLSTPNGFASLAGNIGAGTAPSQAVLDVFWKIAAGSDSAPVVAADANRNNVNCAVVRILAPRPVGNPWVGTPGNADTSGTNCQATGINSTVDGSLILYIIAENVDSNTLPYTAFADATLSSTGIAGVASNTGAPGGGFAVGYGTLASHGATGTGAFTNSTSVTDAPYLVIEIPPVVSVTVTPTGGALTSARGTLGVSNAATVTTQAVTAISGLIATGNGTLTADGTPTVTERGVCWNTSTGPTISNSTSAVPIDQQHVTLAAARGISYQSLYIASKNKIFAVTSGAYAERFDNLDDLTSRTEKSSVQDPSNVYTCYDLLYDSGKDLLYIAGFYQGFHVVSLDPDDMTTMVTVVNDTTAPGTPKTNSITSDGTYLYVLKGYNGGTAQTTSVRKIRLSDNAVIGSDLVVTGFTDGRCIRYDSVSGKLYATGSITGGWIARIDPSGWTVEDAQNLPAGHICPTDYCDFQGNYVWLGMEDTTLKNVLRVQKDSLTTVTEITTGISNDCWGPMYDGTYIWTVFQTNPGKIGRIDPSTLSFTLITLDTGSGPNKLLKDSRGHYYAGFLDDNPSSFSHLTALDAAPNGAVAVGAGTGAFTAPVTGLTAGTTYYVRAYATNTAGTSYGSEVTFLSAVALTGASLTISSGTLTISTPSPDVTVTPTGASLTASAGTLTVTPSITVDLAGNQAALSAGTLTATGGATVTPLGQQLGTSGGTLSITGNSALTLTGNQATVSEGTLSITGGAIVTPTGASLQTSSGTLSLTGSAEVTPTGQSLTSALGSLTVTTTTPDVTVSITGQSLAASSGSLSISGSSALTVTGVSSTLSSGTLTATGGAIVTPTGQSATSAAGTLSITGSATLTATGTGTGDVTVTPAGQALTASAGTLSVAGSSALTLTGANLALSSGLLTLTGSSAVTIAGVQAAVSRGTLTASADVNVTLSGSSLQAFQGALALVGSANVALVGRSVTVTAGHLGVGPSSGGSPSQLGETLRQDGNVGIGFSNR